LHDHCLIRHDNPVSAGDLEGDHRLPCHALTKCDESDLFCLYRTAKLSGHPCNIRDSDGCWVEVFKKRVGDIRIEFDDTERIAMGEVSDPGGDQTVQVASP
jgi:hypothetical protein